jgi:mannose-6-phosphate isomerase-like protein (cupin superfamily)
MQLGEETVEAGPDELVIKPRGQWHAFWNAGDEPTRLLEIISPGRSPSGTGSARARSGRSAPSRGPPAASGR